MATLTEDKLQQECYVWFNNNYCLAHHLPRFYIFSVPNGGYRTPSEAKRLKLTGLRAGVSDLVILAPEKVLFIEMKLEKGIQSDSQKNFEQIVTKLGHEYFLVRSFDAFKNIIFSLVAQHTTPPIIIEP